MQTFDVSPTSLSDVGPTSHRHHFRRRANEQPLSGPRSEQHRTLTSCWRRADVSPTFPG